MKVYKRIRINTILPKYKNLKKTIMKNKSLLLAIATLIITINCKAQADSKTITDVDGNVYHTVTIGTQTWLVENLKTSKYNDGTPIPNVTNGSAWNALTTGAWCNYKNSKANDAKYGKLYNWYAVGTGMLAPVGWHVATNADWSTLNSYVANHTDFSGTVGKALAATTAWDVTTDIGAIGNDLKKNNSTGFSALPGGGRLIEDSFYLIGDYGTWWTSSDLLKKAHSKDLGSRYGTIIDSEYEKTKGLAVRCVKGDVLTSLESKTVNAKQTLVTDIDCNQKNRGLDYIKNFQVCSTHSKMDKKLDQSDRLILHLNQSEIKLNLEIYDFTKVENNYKIAYSLCYIDNVLFLVNLNISYTDEKGAANIQSLIETIKFQLGYTDSQKVDNALLWTFVDYSAIIKMDNSDYNVTLMNRKTGQKFLSQEKTYKFNSGIKSH